MIRGLEDVSRISAAASAPQRLEAVLRHGIDFDHAHPQFGPLLQVMPWPVYSHMAEHDLRAIYPYLSAIPHAETGPAGP